MDPKPSRRKLDFRDFDGILADLDLLQSRGYDKAGNWDLAQLCKHLNDWMRYPIDGYPKPSLPIRMILAAMRVTIGRKQFRKILETRSFTPGGPTMPETVAKPGGDESQAVAELRRTIERFRNHQGPFHASPVFGEFTPETARELQLIHCSHHLSFLVPK